MSEETDTKILEMLEKQSRRSVSRVINNPVAWLLIVGTCLSVITTLIVDRYNSDRVHQETKILQNGESIDTHGVIITEVQLAQKQIITSLGLLTKSISKLSDGLDGNFSKYIRPFEQRLSHAEAELNKRQRTIRHVEDHSGRILALERQFQMLEGKK